MPLRSLVAALALALASQLAVAAPARANEEFRADLLAILVDLEDVANTLNDAELARLVRIGHNIAANLATKELEVLLDKVANLKALRVRVAALRAAVDQASADAFAASLVAPAIDEEDFPVPKPFPGFPPFDFLCTILGNTAVTGALLEAEIVVDVVHEGVAEEACDETIELVGEGGNLSVACIPTGVILAGIKGIVKNAEFCRAGQHENLDEATHEGTKLVYEEVLKVEDIDADIQKELIAIQEQIAELRGVVVSLAMEQSLAMPGVGLSRFQEPGPEGLDEIRSMVVARIEMNETQLGRSTFWARRYLAIADLARSQGNFSLAFQNYKRAYATGP